MIFLPGKPNSFLNQFRLDDHAKTDFRLFLGVLCVFARRKVILEKVLFWQDPARALLKKMPEEKDK
jgi:hypothetical protein